jgi:hypothetical protein
MRHKTITLCPTTYETARKMENFSQWVRYELRKHRDPQQTTLDDLAEENNSMKELLVDIRDGKKSWVSPHGWMKCGEEE